jgi:hypothetical protein
VVVRVAHVQLCCSFLHNDKGSESSSHFT